MHHHDGFRELDPQVCLRLLGEVSIGRIVYTDQALPAVLPVNFSLDQDFSVVLCTSAASRVARAVGQAVVAFEVDRFDEAAGTGWSVVVMGPAVLVTDPGECERLLRTGPRAWVPVPDGVFIRIRPELVTGRVVDRNAFRSDRRVPHDQQPAP